MISQELPCAKLTSSSLELPRSLCQMITGAKAGIAKIRLWCLGKVNKFGGLTFEVTRGPAHERGHKAGKADRGRGRGQDRARGSGHGFRGYSSGRGGGRGGGEPRSLSRAGK